MRMVGGVIAFVSGVINAILLIIWAFFSGTAAAQETEPAGEAAGEAAPAAEAAGEAAAPAAEAAGEAAGEAAAPAAEAAGEAAGEAAAPAAEATGDAAAAATDAAAMAVGAVSFWVYIFLIISLAIALWGILAMSSKDKTHAYILTVLGVVGTVLALIFFSAGGWWNFILMAIGLVGGILAVVGSSQEQSLTA